MTWDDTAYKYTIHALGAVEASMDYGAVNPNDVISVGLLQWYAQRAANVLAQMRTTNPTVWSNIAPSLEASMAAHGPTDSYWSNRYVTLEEINSLHTVLRDTANITIQDAQAQTDIDNDYLPAGAAVGIDKDANPETMAFFINIYNRNPTGARRIVGNCGGDASLDRIYSYTINDQTESSFKTRYSEAKSIIAAHDITGVGSGITGGGGGTPPPTTGGNGGGGSNGTPPTGKAGFIQQRGSQLVLFNKDKTKQIFQKTGTDTWIASFDTNVGTTPAPPPVSGTPTPPAGGTTPQGITDLIAWELTKIGFFAYSEGAGRLNPPASGYTDCSGLHYWAYKTYAATYIGTWTGEQITKGRLITKDPTIAKDESKLALGDMFFFRWGSNSPSSYDHAELYKGNNEMISHGGPGNGPHLFSIASQVDEAINGGGSIEVRRYLP
jgi:cell wall-associated NlpC family hydrolase